MMTGRSRDAPPDRWERAAAVIVSEREAATDEACGRADSTALAGSAAGPRDRARAAWDCECRAADPGVTGTSLGEAPTRVAHARQRGIRTKWLRFLDFASGKQQRAGRIWPSGDDFRHKRRSGCAIFGRTAYHTFAIRSKSRATTWAAPASKSKGGAGNPALWGLALYLRRDPVRPARPVMALALLLSQTALDLQRKRRHL
jgi:hypothetical protein